MTENIRKSLKIPKGIIWIRKSIDNTMAKWKKKRNGQIMINKTLHRNLNIEKHEPHLRLGVNTDAPEKQAVTPPLVAPIVFL